MRQMNHAQILLGSGTSDRVAQKSSVSECLGDNVERETIQGLISTMPLAASCNNDMVGCRSAEERALWFGGGEQMTPPSREGSGCVTDYWRLWTMALGNTSRRGVILRRRHRASKTKYRDG